MSRSSAQFNQKDTTGEPLTLPFKQEVKIFIDPG